jgi:uncharacterized protein YeeX (DUF496 family)
MNTIHNVANNTPPSNTRQLITKLKADNEDFEWYPTTQSMIDAIKNDIAKEHHHKAPTVLDCGAGDGRVLNALTHSNKYAIEKSRPLLTALDDDIYIVGTDFIEQTLIDKKVDIIFSNPPYSDYEYWASKIITEGNAGVIYLIIPDRWAKSWRIQRALESREAEIDIIGNFDFLSADRRARANVNIVKIWLQYRGHRHTSPKIDPFDVWFNQYFTLNINKRERSKYDLFNESREKIKATSSQTIIEGRDLGAVLVQLYDSELEILLTHYKKLESLDPDLLKELDVNMTSVKEGLKMKIEGLKDVYWEELFNHFQKITDRLTSNSRKKLLDKLTQYTHVDFTLSNIYAIAIWVIKNSNQYLDTQLINMVETMTERANIHNYVSNQRTFKNEEWRYRATPQNLTHYQLEYRIVLERVGGLGETGKLSTRANELINDLCTIASNIGFDTRNFMKSGSYEWESRRKNTFLFQNRALDCPDILCDVAAFKNGNLHLSLNQDFMMRLNVEFGRLKGWIKSPKEASTELDIPLEDAVKAFQSNVTLENTTLLSIGIDLAEQPHE